MHIGMRIPPMVRDLGFEGVVAWASANGFGSIDVPEVNRKVRKICDRAGLRIDTVDWGVADWKWVVARLEEIGYDGPLAIELEDDRYMGSTERNQEGLLAARAYLKQIIR